MIKVIGIDPGLADTGVGVVSGHRHEVAAYAFGVVSTSSSMALPLRLNKLYSELYALFESERPHLIILEDVFSLARYPKSGISLGQVTGIIFLAAAKLNIAAKTVSVREAKKILTGKGSASKQQLELAVRDYLKHKTKITPLHASDALCLALIGLFRYHENMACQSLNMTYQDNSLVF